MSKNSHHCHHAIDATGAVTHSQARLKGKDIKVEEIGLLAVNTQVLFDRVAAWFGEERDRFIEDAPMWKDYRSSDQALRKLVREFIASSPS